ncbi:hypothetical protein CZ814_01725 [Photobacterium toruni]|uniref:Uncharacterized protein n=1 Tax=Photobacterium toruni TaxID=1935446 RepID=A0A1T4SS09_9GAMM|nr:hypothetical protein CZ814_01725 [Photobacterium toruni]
MGVMPKTPPNTWIKLTSTLSPILIPSDTGTSVIIDSSTKPLYIAMKTSPSDVAGTPFKAPSQ